MSRHRRLVIPGLVHYVVQQGHNRGQCFFGEEDYQFYLKCLRAAARITDCKLYGFALSRESVQLIVEPQVETALSRLLQVIGRHYVPFVNKKYRRKGTLWDGRFRSMVIDHHNYLLPCLGYVENSPVRNGSAESPHNWPWSSFMYHAHGQEFPFLHPHPAYISLAATPLARQATYRQQFHDAPRLASSKVYQAISSAQILGDPPFVKTLEQQLTVRLTPRRLGRPRKYTQIAAQPGFVQENPS